jgi:hypothetical protein
MASSVVNAITTISKEESTKTNGLKRKKMT